MMSAPATLILVATDLTEASDEAIAQASAWAQRRDARLMAVHVLPDPSAFDRLLRLPAGDAAATKEQQREQATLQVTQQLHRVLGSHSNDVETAVAFGSAHGEVLALAKRVKPVLLVVAASTKDSLQRLVLGSTAEQVLRHASSPVLVARPSPSTAKVMAATDLSDMALGAVDLAVVEASRLRAPLCAAYCVDVARPLTATFNPFVIVDDATHAAIVEAAHVSLTAVLAGFDASAETLVANGDPKVAIAKLARKHEVSLLVVGTHGHTGPSRLLLGSVAEAVARSASCSVLVARTVHDGAER